MSLLTHNNTYFSIGNGVASAVSLFPPIHAWYSASNVDRDANNRIATWFDSSGNGNHVHQPTQANKPLWNANDANFMSHPSISFNGSTEFFNGGNINNPETDNFYIWVVGIGSNRNYLAKSAVNNTGFRYGFWANTIIWHGVNIIVDLPLGIGTDLKELIETRRLTSGAVSAFRNRNLTTSGGIEGNSNFISNNLFLIGAHNSDSGGIPPWAYFNGRMTEIIISKSPTVLSDNQIASVQTYLNGKYGIF